MKVTEALKKKRPTISFEFFPPRTEEQEKHLFQVIAELKSFRPDFVSVTYGAMGTTREKTFFWAKEIKQHYQLEPVAHLTCVAATKDDISAQVGQLVDLGIENILALRGDPPVGHEIFVPPANGFHHASDLVAHIKQLFPALSLGVAGYPEGHPESTDPEQEISHLKAKIAAGATYIITQLFFDTNHYFSFVDRCHRAGIFVPIIPGIMPITNLVQIKKFTEVCGATLPTPLLSALEKHQANPTAIIQIGVEQAVKQCRELNQAGVPGLHFFVLNQSGPISLILNQLKN